MECVHGTCGSPSVIFIRPICELFPHQAKYNWNFFSSQSQPELCSRRPLSRCISQQFDQNNGLKSLVITINCCRWRMNTRSEIKKKQCWRHEALQLNQIIFNCLEWKSRSNRHNAIQSYAAPQNIWMAWFIRVQVLE